MINIIVAVSDNNAIGRNGGMPWHIPADMKYFKGLTSGHTVIMGRKTWESIGSKPLPNRRNIVISRTMQPSEGVEVVGSISDLGGKNAVTGTQGEEISAKIRSHLFIIGGGEIYRQAMDIADRVYITKIHTVVDDADTFFPNLSPEIWSEIDRSQMFKDEKSGYDFEFITYERIK